MKQSNLEPVKWKIWKNLDLEKFYWHEMKSCINNDSSNFLIIWKYDCISKSTGLKKIERDYKKIKYCYMYM